MESLGARVRRARLARGWTQAELAKRLRQHVTMVSQIECGKREPNITNLRRLTLELVVCSDYLLGFVELFDGDKKRRR